MQGPRPHHHVNELAAWAPGAYPRPLVSSTGALFAGYIGYGLITNPAQVELGSGRVYVPDGHVSNPIES